ncbi:hypothetical protein ACWDWT_39895 [Streptomyces sp. NPDC003343]|uniref:hypothetical protein n=1 Tax=Streptomyces TaxID=1883 RepID=UPI0031E9EDA0
MQHCPSTAGTSLTSAAGSASREQLLLIFEQVVNLVRRHAPKVAIAFNMSGGDSIEAANRWL